MEFSKLIETTLNDEKLQNAVRVPFKSSWNFITSLMGSVYLGDSHEEEDFLEESDAYVDLDDDAVEELRSELAKRVGEARWNLISECGAASSLNLWKK